MLRLLKARFIAALMAFKDPWLCHEAEEMREVVDGLGDRNSFALLSGVYFRGRIYARVDAITYEQRNQIREIIGHFPRTG